MRIATVPLGGWLCGRTAKRAVGADTSRPPSEHARAGRPIKFRDLWTPTAASRRNSIGAVRGGPERVARSIQPWGLESPRSIGFGRGGAPSAIVQAAAERLVDAYLGEGSATKTCAASRSIPKATPPCSTEVMLQAAALPGEVPHDAHSERPAREAARVFDTLATLARKDGWQQTQAAGYGGLSAALSAHLFRAPPPETSGAMSAAQLEAKAGGGHDLAAFGPALTDGTPFAGGAALAITGSTLWLLTLPVVAVGMRILQFGAKRGVVPDHVALHHWLVEQPSGELSEALFAEVLGTYERRCELGLASGAFLQRLRACALEQARLHPEMTPPEFVAAAEELDPQLGVARWELQREICGVDAALLARLPGRELRRSKNAILREWRAVRNAAHDTSTAPRWWGRIGLALLGTAPIARFLGMLGGTIAALAPITLAMSYVVPTLQAVVLGLCGWETFHELKEPDTVVPRRAKRLSIARTIGVVVAAVAVMSVVLAPGPNLALLPVVACAILTVLVTGIWKNRLIFRTYRAHLAALPSRAVYMRACRAAYQQQRLALELRCGRGDDAAHHDAREQTGISHEKNRRLRQLDRAYRHLRQWQRDVDRGIRYGVFNGQEMQRVSLSPSRPVGRSCMRAATI